MTPLRRVGAPEEIAEAAAWLISPAAAFVTGSVVTVRAGARAAAFDSAAAGREWPRTKHCGNPGFQLKLA